MIDTIILFAAGRGYRMGHLTADKPKCLINIANRPILEYSLSLCRSYNFKKIVINTHYMAAQINEYIDKWKAANPCDIEFILIYEDELYETGGAVKNIANIIYDEAVFTLNTDIIILPQENIFEHMLQYWNSNEMDFLLLSQRYNDAFGYRGNGDFDLLPDNQILRTQKNAPQEFIYAGLQILKPSLIAQNTQKIFSLREYYVTNPKVRAIVSSDGTKWFHASCPEDIEAIESAL